MARPLWSGALSFGLVNVPVALYSAVRDRDVHFNQLHEPDGSPIETRRVCASEGKEVPWEEIAKGYELDDGRWVLLSDAELEAAAPRKSHAIEIEAFVDEREIDPVYYERPYLLVADNESAARAYELLAEVMRKSGKVALGRFVMRAKEHLVSVRPGVEALMLTTMRFQDEVRATEEIVATFDARATPTAEEIENAIAIIHELEVPFEPERYHDEHRAHLERIIKRKQKGQKISVAKAKESEPSPSAPDLMGALQESLARIRGEASGQQAPTKRKAKARGAGKARAARAEKSRGGSRRGG